MKLRAQLPVRSPLDAAVMAAAARGWLVPDPATPLLLAAELGSAFDAREVLLTDSGTTALRLAIQGALAARPGAAVALPAWGCYDLATAADGAGARVVLYDLEPRTLSPDPDSLRRALAGDVAAVVVAHFHGVPADLDGARLAAAATGALLIEDAAQAIGASMPGGPAGAGGELTVLSFGRGKGFSGGGGGALLAHQSLEGLMAQARGRLEPARRGMHEVIGLTGQWLLGRPAVYGIPLALPFLDLGRTVYHPPRRPGVMPTAAAAALRVAWPGALAEVAIRRRNATRLREAAPAAASVVPPPESHPSWLRLPVLFDTEAAAAVADGAAAHALGVYRGYPLALVDLPGFGARVINREAPFPGARRLASSLVTVPTHGLLTESDLQRLAAWLAAA